MARGKSFSLISGTVKDNVIEFIRALPTDANRPFIVKIHEKTRTLAQNAAMWACLTDISRQVCWHGHWLTPEDWKHIFTATLKGQRTVPDLDGNGFIVLGQSTSRMSVSEMTEVIELARAFGVEHGVRFTDDERKNAQYFKD